MWGGENGRTTDEVKKWDERTKFPQSIFFCIKRRSKGDQGITKLFLKDCLPILPLEPGKGKKKITVFLSRQFCVRRH
jgi:hypothetical protein